MPAERGSGSGVSGIVLAGGRSARFGSDKLAQPVGGEPLLHRAVRAMAQVSDEVLVVVSPSGGLRVLPNDLSVPARTIRDDEPHIGPLAALGKGLTTAQHPVAIVAGGDMPWLSPRVLSLLADRLRSGDVDAVALELSGEGQPLPLAVSRSALVTIRGLLAEGDRSLRSMLARTRVDLVDEPAWRSLDPTARTLADIDVPADLMSGGDRTA